MTLQQIRYAIAISENGSFNKAAEKLFVSQPSLTNAIKEIENELGITIFERSKKGVTLTNDGVEFLAYAKVVQSDFRLLMDKYCGNGPVKKKFAVSTQHYSFSVKSFVEMVAQMESSEYEFSIRETQTRQVVTDVGHLRSEVGILYLSDFNRKVLTKLMDANGCEFHPLMSCKASVYLWKNHPLARKKSITFQDLEPYPNLSFEQGDADSVYLAEEICSTRVYPRTIKANDRATMLNLMRGLNGYTLCSGITCEELNGDDLTAVPLVTEEDERMEIGYVVKKNIRLTKVAELYLDEIKKYLLSVAKKGKHRILFEK